jgi:hypothetical protein
MHLVEELDSGTIKRLGMQGRFLLRVHQAALAKDPTSHATESSRSNLMAAQHTVMLGRCTERLLREQWLTSLHRPRPHMSESRDIGIDDDTRR